MDDLLYQSLYRYFQTRSNYGYKSYDGVIKLIIYMFLVEFLDEFRDRLTDEEIRQVEMMINCLYGSDCLISFPSEC